MRLAFVTTTALVATVYAGPLGYAVCQAGCASVVMACYAAGGATWGATLGATAPATIVGCNAAYGTCQVCSLLFVTNDEKVNNLTGRLRRSPTTSISISAELPLHYDAQDWRESHVEIVLVLVDETTGRSWHLT